MELPLTEPCPQCGAEMEPQGVGRRSAGIAYVCPDCGYEMIIPDSSVDPSEPE